MSEKPASTIQPIHDVLQRRWSPRAFNGQSISQDSLLRMFEAARWAPSRNNKQPWYFLMARRDDEKQFGEMYDCLKPGNQRWAGAAGALIIVVAQLVMADKGPFAPFMYDVGLAVSQLTFQAESEGLRVHQMGGIERDLIIQKYGIPEGHNPLVGLAVGYEGDAGALPEDLQARESAPRQRRPLDEIVYQGMWGQSAHLGE